MALFKLAVSGPGSAMPAAGLYYYSGHHDTLAEFVVGLDGQLEPLRLQVVAPLASLPSEAWASDWPLPTANWIIAVPEQGRTGYLTMSRLDPANLPPRIWTDLLEQVDGVGRPCFALKEEVHPSLVYILEQRFAAGYRRARARASLQPAQPLEAHTWPFWQALSGVGGAIIAHTRDSLLPGAGGRRFFDNPFLVFQLNRCLAEGFIEGHVASGITESGNYAVQPHSSEGWQRAIKRASEQDGPLDFSNLSAEEQAILTLLCESIEVGGQIAATLLKALPDLAVMLGVVTPGKGSAQTIVFWGMHHPHWIVDLVGVLKALKAHGAQLSEGDIERLTEIFALAVETSDDRTASFSFAVMGELMRSRVAGVLRALRARA